MEKRGEGKRSTLEVGSMLEVEEALARILEGIEPLPEKLIPANSALGRMTSRDVVAGHHIPPSPISAMDGFAIRAEDTVEAERKTVRLGVVGEIPCGHFPEQEVIPGTAMRIMTVAPLPPGANTVLRFEWGREEAGFVVPTRAVPPGQDVRPAGEDVQAGEVVIPAGAILRRHG